MTEVDALNHAETDHIRFCHIRKPSWQNSLGQRSAIGTGLELDGSRPPRLPRS
jgi:hypothetical protein